MKKIEEIRVNDKYHIGGVLGSIFLNHMGDYSMGNEVNILGIQFHFEDLVDNIIDIGFNHNNTYNLFYMHVNISQKHFESLENKTKIEFICKCIYKALLEWAKKFNLPEEPIHLANKKIIANDFFCESSKKYKSKNKKYTCSIEYRYEFESTTYRLNVLDNNTKEIRKYVICNKKYFKDNELMKTDYMKWLNTPRTLKVTGWINENEFEMNWGEEKFIFNILTTEINILMV
ncbi:hypothetical protein EG240_15640 [Paenimyroides tangerinum]|uniref:Uncharacterized protein n=1 Tax=Paenimyroides tangerinum TaxID=2488728 RepID=A0A3P3VZ71_9FLAO|nr:hypothetical protein [Paenimyroides tangerinum]RRJ86916.1 hypothetical protein EG240_15640 [Paenimyroides tangerinum]